MATHVKRRRAPPSPFRSTRKSDSLSVDAVRISESKVTTLPPIIHRRAQRGQKTRVVQPVYKVSGRFALTLTAREHKRNPLETGRTSVSGYTASHRASASFLVDNRGESGRTRSNRTRPRTPSGWQLSLVRRDHAWSSSVDVPRCAPQTDPDPPSARHAGQHLPVGISFEDQWRQVQVNVVPIPSSARLRAAG